MAGGLPGNAALTLLRCRRRRARPDVGDSAKDVERQRHNYGRMALARVQWFASANPHPTDTRRRAHIVRPDTPYGLRQAAPAPQAFGAIESLMTIIPNKGAGVMGAPVIHVPGQGDADANQK